MRRIISFITAALTLAACSTPTGPPSGDRATDVAKAKAALGAASTGRNTAGRLVGN